MAQLANVLRITLENARMERTGGGFPLLGRRLGDADVWMEYRAETRRRSGAEWVTDAAAHGRITGAEVLHWVAWLRTHAALPRRGAEGDVVWRLWTPLAGQHTEIFLWREAATGLAMLALFTPDDAAPHQRLAVEAGVSGDDLMGFAQALEAEYRDLKACLL